MDSLFNRLLIVAAVLAGMYFVAAEFGKMVVIEQSEDRTEEVGPHIQEGAEPID